EISTLNPRRFILKPGILTPYRAIGYHLKESSKEKILNHNVDVDQSIIDAVNRELLQERNIDKSQLNQQRNEKYRHATLLRDNIVTEM
ncbi:hypothetical protein HN51_066630, partial [Arachis hypogaea]